MATEWSLHAFFNPRNSLNAAELIAREQNATKGPNKDVYQEHRGSLVFKACILLEYRQWWVGRMIVVEERYTYDDREGFPGKLYLDCGMVAECSDVFYSDSKIWNLFETAV